MDPLSTFSALQHAAREAAQLNEEVQRRIKEKRLKVTPEEYLRTLQDLSWTLVAFSQTIGVWEDYLVDNEKRLDAIERRMICEDSHDRRKAAPETTSGRFLLWLQRHLRNR